MRRSFEVRKIERFETSGGEEIFQIPLEAFPDFWVNAFLVLAGDHQVLVDCGSGYGESDGMLVAALADISDQTGRPVSLVNLTHILITHAHIDHFGGLVTLAERTPALIGIHELDRPVLTGYPEHVARSNQQLMAFLIEAGVPDELRRELDEMHRRLGTLYRSVRVDFPLTGAEGRVGPFDYLHTPGHAAGHVVFRLDDVLIAGDHVLAEISPHQVPGSLRAHTGLAQYLSSLEALLTGAEDTQLVLCGHNGAVRDLPGRIREIQALHQERLDQLMAYLERPRTIAQVADHLFGQVNGYNRLLAIEEAGAHVEFLHQRGELFVVADPSETELERSTGVWYRRRHDASPV